MMERNSKLEEEHTRGARQFLSPREVEILSYAANGLADKQIARQMGLQLSTVRTYWERARQKLNAANRTHAVSMLVALGLVNVNIGHLAFLTEAIMAKNAIEAPKVVHPNGKT
jgi:DNA-binding NarL/FixJ family response regulator